MLIGCDSRPDAKTPAHSACFALSLRNYLDFATIPRQAPSAVIQAKVGIHRGSRELLAGTEHLRVLQTACDEKQRFAILRMPLTTRQRTTYRMGL